jgi:hypothetical protein
MNPNPMTRVGQFTIALLASVLSLLQVATAQNKRAATVTDNYAGQDLKMVVIGEKIMSTGRHGAFRIYEAPNGTRATVSYATFDSTSDAQRQTRQWLRYVRKILRREKRRDRHNHVIGERAVALDQTEEATQEVYLIIRRDGLNCYLIDSPSLSVALQVEKLIED